MVAEYADRFYMPSATRYQDLTRDNLAAGSELAAWLRTIYAQWPGVQVESVQSKTEGDIRVGAKMQVTAKVRLGDLKPDDVTVELYHGDVDAAGAIQTAQASPMALDGKSGAVGSPSFVFEGTITCRASGQHGYSVRVVPRHKHLPHVFEPGLIRWG
ncbi:MAG: alpha-glucan phosphorylase, partial [Planctomycetia bacterium]